MMSVVACKLTKLFKSSNRLICIHGSGKALTNSPPAPPTPNIEIMMSREGDTYLRAVSEADTTLWRPGSAKPSQLKRLQQEPKRGKGRRGGYNSYNGRGLGLISFSVIVSQNV